MSKKQTAIEWLISQIEEKGAAWENASIRRVQISIDVSEYMELKKQAQAMHREEIAQLRTENDRLRRILDDIKAHAKFVGDLWVAENCEQALKGGESER